MHRRDLCHGRASRPCLCALQRFSERKRLLPHWQFADHVEQAVRVERPAALVHKRIDAETHFLPPLLFLFVSGLAVVMGMKDALVIVGALRATIGAVLVGVAALTWVRDMDRNGVAVRVRVRVRVFAREAALTTVVVSMAMLMALAAALTLGLPVTVVPMSVTLVPVSVIVHLLSGSAYLASGLVRMRSHRTQGSCVLSRCLQPAS